MTRGASYRTLCVRLCDGFYFPINFQTPRSRFHTDAAACEASCQSPARLFVYPNPGGSIEHMTDLQGRPYSQLDTAFLYRTEYNPDCRCKPDPWTQEAKIEFEERVIAEQERQEQELKDAQIAQARAAQLAARRKAMQSRARRRPPRRRPVRRWSLFGN